MQTVFVFLAGFFVGGFVVRWLMIRAEHRIIRPHQLDPHYEPMARAVVRHLQVHGTINAVQATQMLTLTTATAAQHLRQMVRDGLLKLHGHRSAGEFYTLK